MLKDKTRGQVAHYQLLCVVKRLGNSQKIEIKTKIASMVKIINVKSFDHSTE